MLTKSKLLVLAAAAAVASTSPVLAFEPTRIAQWKDAANYSRLRTVPSRAEARQAHRRARNAEPFVAGEPFTAAQKRAFQAPDPYHHPDEF